MSEKLTEVERKRALQSQLEYDYIDLLLASESIPDSLHDLIIENLRDPIHHTLREDTFLLQFAASQGHAVAVSKLIAAGVSVHGKNGSAPLHYARNADVARVLIEAGANVNINIENESGGTPLHYARNADVARVLIDAGANVGARNKRGETALHRACLDSENSDLVMTLIEAGANVNIEDEDGRTPLHFANNVEHARILIEAGANPCVIDNLGRTPLIYQITVDPENKELISFLRTQDYSELLPHMREIQDDLLRKYDEHAAQQLSAEGKSPAASSTLGGCSCRNITNEQPEMEREPLVIPGENLL